MLGPILRANHMSRLDLAHEMGVSMQTVHNWCSGRILIPAARLEELCETLERRGAPADELARLVVHELGRHGLHRDRLAFKPLGARPTVMALAWDLAAPGLFGPITRVARAGIEGLGYECIVVDCGGEHRTRRAAIQQAASLGVAGLLLSGIPGEAPDPDDDLFSSLRPVIAAGIPVVFMKPWTGSTSLPAGVGSIGWDSVAAVEQAVGLLADAGHARIRALLADSGANFGGRYRGLDQVWGKLGLPFSEDECIAWLPRGGSSAEFEEALGDATAVFTPPSNLQALARSCFRRGKEWPRDLSIATLANREFIPQLAQRPFTFVNIPVGRVSRGAAQLLSSMIKGERFQTGQEYVVYGASAMAVENLEGGSVGPPARDPARDSPARNGPARNGADATSSAASPAGRALPATTR